MEIGHEELSGGIVKINLSGRMDVAGSQQINERFAELIAASKNAVIIDLSKVVFLASSGIRSLLVNAKTLSGRGGKMVLLNPDASVTKVLEMSGVDALIGVFHDLKAACSALAGPSTKT